MQTTPTSSAAVSAEVPGLGEYSSILRRRRRLLFMVAAPIAAIGALVAIGLPDVYQSVGHIEIEGATDVEELSARARQEAPYADQYVQTLSTVVLGNKNLRRLLAEHKLYDDQDKNPTDLMDRLRGDINVDIVTVPILDPNTGREREVVTAFTVMYGNHDPRRAQEGAAWLVDAYLAANRSDRADNAANAAKFFGNEAERIRKHVAELETKLAEFKSKHGGQLPEMSQANVSVMDRAENDLSNIQTQIQALQREKVFLNAQLAQAQASGPEMASAQQLEAEYARKRAIYDESHPDVVALRRQIDTLRAGGSVSGMSLKAQLAQQRSILAEARQRYSEDHPDIKRIQRNIQALEARIASGETSDRSIAADSPMSMQLQTQINATDTQIAGLQARALELRTKMSQLESRMSTAPEVEREYQQVTRDLSGARAKYEELRKRQMDAEVNEAAIAGGTADKFQIKAFPTVPDEPAKPERLAIFAVALVLGLFVGLTAVVAAQLFDQTVRGARDIQEILDVTPLTAVPVIQHAGRRPRRRLALPRREGRTSLRPSFM